MILALWSAVVILMVPAGVFGGTITLKAGDGQAAIGQHISVPIEVTALGLGGISGVDALTLNFGAKDPDLHIGTFTLGFLLEEWMDATERPRFPGYAWSFINFSAANITDTGTLGTLEVWSDFPGRYTLAFDVTTAGVATEVAGEGLAFTLTTVPGTILVPEPATLALLAAGGLVLARGRRK
jgi:hypothetical protein